MVEFKNFSLDCFNAFHLALGAVLIAALLSRRVRRSFESRIVGSAAAVDLVLIRIVTCQTLNFPTRAASRSVVPPNLRPSRAFLKVFGRCMV